MPDLKTKNLIAAGAAPQALGELRYPDLYSWIKGPTSNGG